HVLETICRYDYPQLATMTKGGNQVIMRGLYRSDRYQSPFCISSQVKSAFTRLFEGVKAHGAPLVLSYSPQSPDANGRPRLISLEDLQKLGKTYFKRVTVIPAESHSHRKLNKAFNNTAVF